MVCQLVDEIRLLLSDNLQLIDLGLEVLDLIDAVSKRLVGRAAFSLHIDGHRVLVTVWQSIELLV